MLTSRLAFYEFPDLTRAIDMVISLALGCALTKVLHLAAAVRWQRTARRIVDNSAYLFMAALEAVFLASLPYHPLPPGMIALQQLGIVLCALCSESIMDDAWRLAGRARAALCGSRAARCPGCGKTSAVLEVQPASGQMSTMPALAP